MIKTNYKRSVEYKQLALKNLELEQEMKLLEDKLISSRNKLSDKEQIIFELKDQLMQSRRELLEVIRWHINPDTARVPFLKLIKEGEDKTIF